MKNKLLRLLTMLSKIIFYGIATQVLCLGMLLAYDGVSQNIKPISEVNLNFRTDQVSIQTVFDQIESKTDYHFFYDETIIDTRKMVTLKKGKRSISDVLLNISKQSHYKFKQINKVINVNLVDDLSADDNVSIEIVNQDRTVTGTVNEADTGDPIPGANVVVKGTTNGTVTDLDGNYSLNISGQEDVLVFSFVGFVSQEIAVGNQSVITVSLASDVTALSEVVVIGYGTVKKSDLTGSVTSVKESDFNKGIYASPDALLQGRAPGVHVFSNDGTPGGGTTVRIRGNSSVRAGNQPLYVVDGVPLDGRSAKPGLDAPEQGGSPESNPLNFLNPNDIASMEVLKDASATAIYGSRGANGVIIITTKKGKSGAPVVDFTASLGASRMANSIEVLSGGEYRAALNDYGLTGGDFGGDEDAMDYITRTAMVQNYNMSVGGGGENGNYRVSFGYLDQPGIIKSTGIKKYNFSTNGSFNFIEDRFKIDFNVTSGVWNEDGASITNSAGFTGDLIAQALQWNPTRPLLLPDGTPDIELGSSTINPAGNLEHYSDKSRVTNILASLAPSIVITKSLVYKFQVSLFQSVGSRETQIGKELNVQGVEGRGWAGIANNRLSTQQYTHTLSYDKELTSSLYLNAVLGYEYQVFANKGFGMSAQDFLVDDLPYTDYMWNSSQSSRLIDRRDATKSTGQSFTDPSSKLQSFFGRFNFNIDEKYLITATFRADGSSKFGENNRYGYFPSFAGKWNLANEDFLTNSDFINTLSLRVGWGQTGNQEFPAGASQERYALGKNQVFDGLENVANPDLKWETSSTINIGIDYAFLDAKITGTLEYFNKTTEDLLFNFKSIPPAPGSRYWTNLEGKLINKGFEFAINYQPINTQRSVLEFGLNMSFLDNVLKEYNGPDVLTGNLDGQGISNTTIQRIVNDKPINAFYLREWNGLDESGFDDLTDDGNSFFYIGDPNPDVLLGFTATYQIGKLDFVANFYGAFGHQIYNNTANTVLPIGNLGSRNIAKAIVEQPVKESTANSIKASTRYLEDGDYFKFTNFAVSYSAGDLYFVKNIRFSLTGQNLFTITNYSGFDPEVNTDKSRDDVPSFGIEYTAYPTPRTFILGVNFSF
ncbi:MAG: SusC/RagA family TonB-linked outer membrane protein [Cytophagales bacterium]|nr:SusC/RagA family TonB-linked outer membrane protein [Cytophagales bacterium]